jgi:hypothetical protein
MLAMRLIICHSRQTESKLHLPSWCLKFAISFCAHSPPRLPDVEPEESHHSSLSSSSSSSSSLSSAAAAAAAFLAGFFFFFLFLLFDPEDLARGRSKIFSTSSSSIFLSDLTLLRSSGGGAASLVRPFLVMAIVMSQPFFTYA